MISHNPRNHLLVQSSGPIFGDKVYICVNGRKHYLPEVKRLVHYRLNWPEDIIKVPDPIVESFAIAGWVPNIFDPNLDVNSISRGSDMREFIGMDLSGFGLEVGAGASPFPVPLHCRVLFGDHITYEKLVDDLYPGQQGHQLVNPDIITNFSSLNGICDQSLDFIIACHVIEHVFDPIGALFNAYQKLKYGGKLVLVVPDKNKTFDKSRPVTEISHLITDHFSPNSDRDFAHYLEFYKLAFVTPDDMLSIRATSEFEKGGDLHVHVWDYASFGILVEWVNNNLVKWSSVWSHETLPGEENNEFYFVLTK
jgi:hypothetical protein